MDKPTIVSRTCRLRSGNPHGGTNRNVIDTAPHRTTVNAVFNFALPHRVMWVPNESERGSNSGIRGNATFLGAQASRFRRSRDLTLMTGDGRRIFYTSNLHRYRS